jgi:aminoglycoside phosphotransferase (APT) family kinase protein
MASTPTSATVDVASRRRVAASTGDLLGTLHGVSRRIQQNALDRGRAAREREKNARERARVRAESGDHDIARLHLRSAELQADAASDADTLLELDQQVEGDQLQD